MWRATRTLVRETARGTALGVAVPVIASFGLSLFDKAVNNLPNVSTLSHSNPHHRPPQDSTADTPAPRT